MNGLWFLLLLLVCPLMMVLMMRGMGSMGDGKAKRPEDQRESGAPPVADPRDERLAELEREIADLRANRDQPDVRQR